jgi:hypothetical protein
VKPHFSIALLAGAALAIARDARADDASPLTIRAGAELAAYQDTVATTVASPTVFAGVEHVLGGFRSRPLRAARPAGVRHPRSGGHGGRHLP